MSNYVISISREFGSGGRLLGKQLAVRLGIPCYDLTINSSTVGAEETVDLVADMVRHREVRHV